MSDPIERQDALDVIKRLMGDSELSRTVQTGLHILPSAQPEDKCGECDAWNQYKNYPRRSRWIPCSERLPEREEQVLIYAMNVHFVLAKYKELRTLDGEYIKDWVIEDAYNPPSLIKHKVIAWMPLTDPYRAERQEDGQTT